MMECSKGVIVWGNGDLYKGALHEDSLHGRGVYKYADGSLYDG
jgi:hypothetical protein